MSSGQRLAAALVLLGGAALRLALFSGYGLGDDPGYFHCYHDILVTGSWNPTRAYDFRFSFWVPVVGMLRLFGVSEAAWVAFITLCSLVNLGLVYLLARQEGWEPAGALLAMALLAVFPLDVLSSTLFVIDIPLATYCFTAFWLYRGALARAGRSPRAWAWAAGAAVFLFLGYSAKQWAVLVGVLFAVEGLRDLGRTWRVSLVSGGGFLVLVAAYFAWQWVRFGDPIHDIHVVRSVAIFQPHSRAILLDYPRMLLFPTEYGAFFGGFHPHVLLLLALLLLGRLLRAGKWLGYTVLLLAALAGAPSHRENGQWVVLVPHIFRYLCLLSIPLSLALAAYLRELVRWRRALGIVVTTGVLVLSVWQSVALTAPTRDAFGEMRQANAVLRTFPDERVASDYDFLARFLGFETGWRWDRVVWLRGESPEVRATEFRRLTDAVVVTGGGRLPWYGCARCIADMASFVPPPTWTPVATLDGGPSTVYRHEPLRIWRVSQAAAEAQRLLAARPDAAARQALLSELVARGRHDVAAEVGRQVAAEPGAPPEVARLAGVACARAGKPVCATRRLADALTGGLDGPSAREAVALLATSAAARRDYDDARAWAGELRRRFPEAAPGVEIEDIESGLTEGVARYHEGRLAVARRRFTTLVAEPDADPRRLRQARYFLALTLFRLNLVPEALEQAAAYRAAHGEDAQWVELVFRHAEAIRLREPAEAHTLYARLAEDHKGTLWATLAQQRLASGAD